MVNEMITSVLALASNEAWLTNSVQNFVAAHRSYGDIPPDAYARLLDVLVDTLAQVAGSRWTDEFETAWRWYVSGMKRSEEHTSELQSLMRISYAVFCLKKTKNYQNKQET